MSENYLLCYINLLCLVFIVIVHQISTGNSLYMYIPTHTHTHTQKVVSHTKKMNIIQVGKILILIIKRGEREGREGRGRVGRGEGG